MTRERPIPFKGEMVRARARVLELESVLMDARDHFAAVAMLDPAEEGRRRSLRWVERLNHVIRRTWR
jgi:hypothetical protein